MEILAHARIVMWQGASLWIVDATPPASAAPRRTDFHAHHAIQVTVSLGGSFSLRTEAESMKGEAMAVAADTRHDFEAEGLIAFLFVEPESRIGRSISQKVLATNQLATVPLELIEEFRIRATAAFRTPPRNDDLMIDIGQALATVLAADTNAGIPDLRVRKLIALAARQLNEPLGLSDAAEVSGLSASRLRHLFVEQTGLPFKTYMLWLRLTRALERYAAGVPLTQAAHESGFSDSAHLSRTFRRMFGIAPTALRIS